MCTQYNYKLLLSTIITCFILISCQNNNDTPSVATGPIVDSVVSVDSVIIEYEYVGKGKPALVFVHGWSCDRSYWKNQIDEFAEMYQVVTIDYGGHGGSGIGTRTDWTMASFGADVAEVVNKLNLSNVILIGHSMGGGVNFEAAKKLGDKVIGLIGVDTYKGFGTGYPDSVVEEYETYFQSDFTGSMEEFVLNFFPEDADTSLVNWVVNDMSQAHPEVAISAMANFFRSNQQEILKEIRLPIYAINCDKWSTDTTKNREHALSFELKLMKGVGHFNQMEDPATFNKFLQETIEELTSKE